MTHYVYILYSQKNDKYYVGHTANLQERLRRHNTEHSGYTGKWNDWEIIYTESYHTKERAGYYGSFRAYQREREIKKWKNRKRIEALIGD